MTATCRQAAVTFDGILLLAGHFPGLMVGVKQMVGYIAEGLFHELPIQLVDLGILVGEPGGGGLVDVPQDAAALFRQLHAVVDGLTAAAGAAAGTGHDLHEVIAYLAPLQGGHELAGVQQAAGHRHGHRSGSGDIELGFLPAVHAPDIPEGVGVGISAGDKVVGAAQGRVHDAAGGAEDHRRAGAAAQRTVKGHLIQNGGVDLLAPEHPDDLTGGQHHVHVRVTAGVPHGGQGRLALFGGAGHDGHHEDVVGVHPQLLGEVALGHGTEHLLGTLGGGQMADILGELGLDEPHPAGTAGGEHGPGVLIPVGEALHKLAALLHDGQVGGEIGVEYIVKAHLLQGGDHALGGGVLGLQVVVFRPGGPDRRGHLDHGDLLGVGQGVEHPAGVVVLLQTAHGTVGHALAAEGAVGVCQRPGPGHADGGAGTGAHQVPDVHTLDLVADLDAAHTADAAVFKPHHGGAEIRLNGPQVLDIVVAQQVIVVGELLELAVAAAGALGTADVVLGQQQPQVHPAGLTDPGGVGVDHDALGHLGVAGGHQALFPLHLHHADAAGADLVDVLQVAQGGNIQAHGTGGLQNGGALRHGDGSVVDGQRYHLISRPPLKMP